MVDPVSYFFWFQPVLHNCLCDGAYKQFLAANQSPVPNRGTCAHDRRALQQLALNVHVKHSDLT